MAGGGSGMAAPGRNPSGRLAARVAMFFGPIGISALVILLAWYLLPDDIFPVFGFLLLGYFLSPFGREVLVPMAVISLLGLHGRAFMCQDMALVVGTVLFVDVMCSIFLLWNLALVRYVPVLGRWIEGVEAAGRKRLRRRGRRQRLFLLLTAYVALPFQGSGGVVSTIVGMLTGLGKRRVWLAIWSGSLIGSVAIALPSFYIGQVLIDIFGSALWYSLGLLVLLGVLLYVLRGYLAVRKENGKTHNA